jgi:hypothetical protein
MRRFFPQPEAPASCLVANILLTTARTTMATIVAG